VYLSTIALETTFWKTKKQISQVQKHVYMSLYSAA
jgi:predicted DNA-binding ribbon-helix-helix protein